MREEGDPGKSRMVVGEGLDGIVQHLPNELKPVSPIIVVAAI